MFVVKLYQLIVIGFSDFVSMGSRRHTMSYNCMCNFNNVSLIPEEGVHASSSVIDLAPPTIGSVHFVQPFSTLLVKGLATPRLLEIWLRGKVQTAISVLGVLPPF